MTASIVMGTLSFVRLICAGTSTVLTRVSMRFAIFSRNGFMVMRPGPRMPRNFPRRSTATRSHSWTMAIARARMASATVATRTAATHSRTISILRAPTHARSRFQSRDGTPMEAKPRRDGSVVRKLHSVKVTCLAGLSHALGREELAGARDRVDDYCRDGAGAAREPRRSERGPHGGVDRLPVHEFASDDGRNARAGRVVGRGDSRPRSNPGEQSPR